MDANFYVSGLVHFELVFYFSVYFILLFPKYMDGAGRFSNELFVWLLSDCGDSAVHVSLIFMLDFL